MAVAMNSIEPSRFHLNVQNDEELKTVNSIIHDCWFHLSELTYNQDGGIVTLPFQKPTFQRKSLSWSVLFLKGWAVPIIEWVATIKSVVQCTVEDQARIDKYDIASIRYNPRQNIISICSGFPLTISLVVHHLDIEIAESDKMFGNEKTISLLS